MKKILVPTDFSPDSKSRIRFAIHWAEQQKVEIVFIHVLNILIPTRWTKITSEKYVAGEMKSCRQRFDKFIIEIYQKMNMQPGTYSTTVLQGYDPGQIILNFCVSNRQIDCICISTRGAGKMMKISGTMTSFLISKSKIPVIAIPKNYKASAITRVLYPTDFRNYKEEIARVIEFASAFKAPIGVLHFATNGKRLFDETTIKAASEHYKPGLAVSLILKDEALTLTESLQRQIKLTKAWVVVMFTNQGRTLFQRIFSSSQTEEVSFQLKAPLLVYPKKMTITKTITI